jgi:hypothetical protein
MTSRKLRLEHLHQAGAVGGGELLEERAGLADLLGQRLGEDATLGAQELLELPRQDALVIDERREALRDLAVLRVKEAGEHGADRLLLLLDVHLELFVDVPEERRADVLQLRLLGSLVSVSEGAQANGPRVVGELVAGGLVELTKQSQAIWTAIL